MLGICGLGWMASLVYLDPEGMRSSGLIKGHMNKHMDPANHLVSTPLSRV